MSSPSTVIACSSSYLSLLGEVLARRGVSLQSWLNDRELDPSLLDDASSYVTLGQASILIERALRLSGDPALGLYFGQRLNMNAHGLLGLAGLVSANIEDALKIGFQFVKTRVPLLGLGLTHQHRHARISITLEGQLSPDVERFAIETVLYSFSAMAHYLIAPELPPLKIQVSFPQPRHDDLYRVFYPAPLELIFSAQYNSIEFPASLLPHPLPLFNQHAQKEVIAQVSRQMDALPNESGSEPELSETINLLLSEMPGHYPGLETISAKLNTSSRTLHRKLHELGLNYQTLLEEHKKRDAINYLRNTKLTITQIAHILGYNDSSNFARAFRKWTGMPPSQYPRR